MKKFPFLCQAAETTWPWPTCINSPTTHSFQANIDEIILVDHLAETSDSFLGNSELYKDETAVIGGLMSDRLFFEPGKTNSILEGTKGFDFRCTGGAEAVEMESQDPVQDFRVSMEEMVAAYGLKDWDCLEELLACYLKVNGRHNHVYIVGAFVDMLRRLELGSGDITCCGSAMDDPCCSSSSSCTAQCSFTFSSSAYSSASQYCSLENEDDDVGRLHQGIDVV